MLLARLVWHVREEYWRESQRGVEAEYGCYVEVDWPWRQRQRGLLEDDRHL